MTTTLAAVWSFALVVGLLTVTPGLDTALVLRTGALCGVRRAWGVVLGVQTGVLAWGVLTSAGVTALLAASHLAYEVLRWAGACYLVWMGVSMLWSTRLRRGARQRTQLQRRTQITEARDVSHEHWPGGFSSGWRRGLLTNLLNPKVGVFYMALLPQFVPAGAPALSFGVLLTFVHIVLGIAWCTVLVLGARRMRALLQRPSARTVMDRVTGTVITGFGLRLAFDSH